MKRCRTADGCGSPHRATGGLVDAGAEYEKALAEEVAKLQRLYGGGDLASFPEFTFTGEAHLPAQTPPPWLSPAP